MDFKPPFNDNRQAKKPSYKYKNKRILWFNSANADVFLIQMNVCVIFVLFKYLIIQFLDLFRLCQKQMINRLISFVSKIYLMMLMVLL